MRTPGPWYRSGPVAEDECGVAGGVDVDVVAGAPNDEPPSTISILDGLSVADADLIAAAPELLAALTEYVEWFGAVHGENCPADDTCTCIGGGLNARVNAAIAKAEGQ